MDELSARWRAMAIALAAAFAMAPAAAEAPGWRLVWHDEFDGRRLDTRCWTYFLDRPYNNESEEQRFMASRENAFLRDGLLHIRAIKRTTTNNDEPRHYTSAQLMTRDLAFWTYGRFEARIKPPAGRGLWPAFWMMANEGHDSPYGGWPHHGEIDIMEQIGRDPGTNLGFIHYFNYEEDEPDNHGGLYRSETPLSDDFHVYALEWSPGRLAFSVDGHEYYVTTEADWSRPPGAGPGAPFDRPFYILLNLSIGGGWGGPPDEETRFPADLLVDWVRVYQDPSVSPEAAERALSCGGR